MDINKRHWGKFGCLAYTLQPVGLKMITCQCFNNSAFSRIVYLITYCLVQDNTNWDSFTIFWQSNVGRKSHLSCQVF